VPTNRKNKRPFNRATGDLDALAQQRAAEHTEFVSPSVQLGPKDKLGFSKGLLIRDPDGHGLPLTEK
jgi:hypothetical protein